MATANQNGPTSQILNTKPYFIGFNTVGHPNPPYTLTDVELVKRDILNQFNTPMGSRVMLPNFGSNIYNYLFDPFDDTTKTNIIQDATRVVESDPRVQLVSIDAYQSGQAMTVAMVLLFQPQALTDSLFVTFTTINQETY
jgi:phage baseplate assembly protein W